MAEEKILSEPSDKETSLDINEAKPADFTSPDELYEVLIKEIKKYHPSTDLSDIKRAYDIAFEAHKEQKRKSGEPYIIHPLCVAIILAQLEMDKETIVAGLLHDVVEDTVMTDEDITREFGAEVALLVDGVTKLTQLNYQHDKIEVQAENLRKMFLAMAKDIRVIIIKLADRLHNMRTMQYQKPHKQIEKSRETMEIYAPIAHRLGISKIKVELDDWAMQYLMPEVYNDLSTQLKSNSAGREAFIQSMIKEVGMHIGDAGIEAQIDGRVKHFFSIYRKMVNQNKTLDQIYDIFAIRIRVDSVKDCYAALGVIHEMYKPIPGRFKDYIAMPKPNRYQSLHTTLIASNGQPFEVQIRTYEMHRIAEYGIAAHWKYKEGQSGASSSDSEEAKISWLRQILEWQKEMPDNKEFLSSVKNDFNLFSDNVYCFTPSGDVKNLPAGSCPIDFAYSIHSAVGNKMVGARVNGKLVPIDYKINNGDRIEVLTSQNSKGPSRDWLSIVRSSQARNKINQWFKTILKEDNIIRGKELFLACCKTKNVNPSDITKPEYIQKVLNKYSYKDWDSLLASIGHGGLKEGQIVNRLLEEYNKEEKSKITDADILKKMSQTTGKTTNASGNAESGQGAANQGKGKANTEKSDSKAKGGVIVKGMKGMAVRLSRCCTPVPGDEIIGFITRGRGVTIHRTDCENVINFPDSERARLIEAEWEGADLKSKTYAAELNIFAPDRTGLIVDVSRIFTEADINLTYMNMRANKKGIATVNVGFNIHGKEELEGIVKKLRNIDGVTDIVRTRG